MEITWADFEKIDIRVGTVIQAESFPAARKPAYRIQVDFGEMGIKNSSAQVTDLYSLEELAGKQVIAVINFPRKQIADFFSECLVLGVYTPHNQVVLLQPATHVPNGSKIG